MIVSKIVESAMKQLGILASGESASGDDITDGIDCLQDLLAQWATNKLYVYKANTLIIPLNGAGEYRIGNKENIQDCCEYEISNCPVCTPDEPVEEPCECTCGCSEESPKPTMIADISMVSDDAWLDDCKIKLVRNTNRTQPVYAPVEYWQEPDAWVFKVGEGNFKQLKLKVYTLPKNLKPKDELPLPPQYSRPLKLTLALEIASMFGAEPPIRLVQNQDNAMEMLKSSNSVPAYATNELPVGVSCHGWNDY
ncbi:hypothetical protein OHV90_17345 [Acinetobacter baumannii]|nr:hypothetical protein [Acinetobacter baumannii]